MKPAVSRLALPILKHDYRVACERARRMPLWRRCFPHERSDLRAQIQAAISEAATWTDAAGTIWGHGNVRVGGTVPPPGEHFDGLDLRN